MLRMRADEDQKTSIQPTMSSSIKPNLNDIVYELIEFATCYIPDQFIKFSQIEFYNLLITNSYDS